MSNRNVGKILGILAKELEHKFKMIAFLAEKKRFPNEKVTEETEKEKTPEVCNKRYRVKKRTILKFRWLKS